jgi:sodium-dependent dicarboxylate transporter 2/3/5
MSSMTICLIIFALTVVGFCTGIWSLATVSILSLLALSLTHCLEAKDAIAYFGNTNVVMIAGMCVVAAGFNRTKFCLSIADRISAMAKGSMIKMMLGYMIIGVLLSQFIQSPVVVFGIVAPMLAASAEAMGIKNSKVMFPLGTAIIITCCTLPLGAGATVAAELNGYLESYGYTKFVCGLADPAKGRLPLMIIATLYCAFILPKFAPDAPITETHESVKKQEKKAPLSAFSEYAGIVIFFADALALMFAGPLKLASWQITLVGALFMVVCGVLKPREATQSVPWSMLLLIVGSLALSGALSSTGAGKLIGDGIGALVTSVGGNSYIVGAIFFLIPFIMTQVMQNRGTMLIFHPIAIATCASIGGNPIGLMILIQAACLSAYMTPMATPAVPYIMDYGGYDQASMFKMSWLLSIICFVVSVFWIMTVFPIL